MSARPLAAGRQEKDQRDDADAAPSVAIVAHGKGIGVGRVADVGRAHGQEADEDDEQHGGYQGKAPPCREGREREDDGGGDPDADKKSPRRGARDLEADAGQDEREQAHGFMEIDVRHVTEVQVPGAGQVEQKIPGHLGGENDRR